MRRSQRGAASAAVKTSASRLEPVAGGNGRLRSTTGVIVIAATNRPSARPCLAAPGRIDVRWVVGLPDIRGRETDPAGAHPKVPLARTCGPTLGARHPRHVGADLANLVNEAALFAARATSARSIWTISRRAKDKILMGAERSPW